MTSLTNKRETLLNELLEDFKSGKAALNHQGNTFFQGLTSTFT